MKTWTVINQHDGNDSFEVEGCNYGEAAGAALEELGWALVEPEEKEEGNEKDGG